MPDNRSTGALKGAIGEILKVAQTGTKATSARKAEADFRTIGRRDYDAELRKHFDPAQLRRMLKEVRKSLPTLNHEVYRITDIGRLTKIASELGVVLQARAFPGAEGAGFRGFYVHEAEVLKRPLIWINTAAPAVAAAAAFWHEIGHHLTNQIWGLRNAPAGAAFGTKYSDQMSDPKEIAADLVRVLAGYPKPIAQRLFGGPDREELRADVDLLVARAMSHVRSVMRFDFQRRTAPKEDLYYLGGMIHTAKLRTTLLTEYGI